MISYSDISQKTDQYIDLYVASSDSSDGDLVECQFRGFLQGLIFSKVICSEVHDTLLNKFLLSMGL